MSRFLTPMKHLTNPTIHDALALSVTRDAAKEDFPLLCDVIFGPDGERLLAVRHYSFLSDLSISEKEVIRSIVRVAAERLDATIEDTFLDEHWKVIPHPPKKQKIPFAVPRFIADAARAHAGAYFRARRDLTYRERHQRPCGFAPEPAMYAYAHETTRRIKEGWQFGPPTAANMAKYLNDFATAERAQKPP